MSEDAAPYGLKATAFTGDRIPPTGGDGIRFRDEREVMPGPIDGAGSLGPVIDPAQHDFALVELHIGNAIHQQAAGPVGALEHGHRVAGAIELCGGSETSPKTWGCPLRRCGPSPR